jgi:hypothetical protein
LLGLGPLILNSYLWINCIEVIAPRKNTVGTAIPWIANHLKVKIGYEIGCFILLIKCSYDFYKPFVKSSSSCFALKRSLTSGTC